MKVFMITWFLVCFLVIVGLFIAYATDNLPGVPTPKQVGLEAKISGTGKVDTSRNSEEDCSPCEENLKRLREARERWERERKAQAVDRGDTE